MSQIINKIHEVDPNDSEAVKGALTPFFQSLSKHTETECNIWLRSLEDVINRFPKYCTPHRVTIENFLTNFLDSTNYYHVIGAAKCALAVQQVKPSQDKDSTPKACWREQMSLLCNAAQSLIEAIFVKSLNIYNNTVKLKKQDLTILANMPLSRSLLQSHKGKAEEKYGRHKRETLITRLQNVFVFIQAMLVEIYPVAKPIRPELILEIIIQVLSMSSSVQGVNISDVVSIKTQALRTLDALIACLGRNLIPFSALVLRCVMQTLRWSSEHRGDESSKVRCSAYNSLSNWLRILHVYRASSENRDRSWEEEITKHIMDDITPVKHVVQLTMRSLPTKNMSKKAKRKMANMMLQESTIAAHAPGEKKKVSVSEESSNELSVAALDCAETFLIVCGLFLKPTTHKIFQEHLVRECFNVEKYGTDPIMAMLRCLEASRKSSPPSVPPPTQYCLHIYSMLVNSQNAEISKFCSHALLDIRLHLHCSPPSLNFAIEQRPEKEKKVEKKKRVSERNRAVLESLLGPDRMPPQDPDEVISIPDEPPNKRQCLDEDISDKISISSASIQSVEIDEISDNPDADSSEIQMETDLVTEEQVEAETDENVEDNETENNIEEQNTINESFEKTEEIVIEEVNGIIDKDIELNIEPVVNEVKEENQVTIEQNIVNEVDGNLNTNTAEQTDSIAGNNNPTAETEPTKVIENIFEAKTQMPVSDSVENDKEETLELSTEVGYDNQNTVKEKVAVIDIVDDENLPCSNDTDDIITCGQAIRNSQEGYKITDNSAEENVEDGDVSPANEVPIENGIDMSVKIVENGDANLEEDLVSVKTVDKTGVVTVEDMLADFVDEVNEENIIEE